MSSTQQLEPNFRDTFTAQLIGRFGEGRRAAIEAAVKALFDTNWLDTPDAMKAAKYETVLAAVGGNAGLADFIKAQYPSQMAEAAPPPPPPPSQTADGDMVGQLVAQMGRMIDAMIPQQTLESMDVLQLLEELGKAAGNRRRQVLNALRACIQRLVAGENLPTADIFVRDSGMIDLPPTVAYVSDLLAGEGAMALVENSKGIDVVPVNLDILLDERTIADPYTGQKLAKGKSRDGVAHWYNGTPTDLQQRLITALKWGRITNLPQLPHPTLRATVADAVRTATDENSLPSMVSIVLKLFTAQADSTSSVRAMTPYYEVEYDTTKKGGAVKTGDRKSGRSDSESGRGGSGEFSW